MPEYVKPRKRPEITPGVTYEAQTGCGTIYVTINEDEKGQPIEVFARLGKAGGCACAQTEAVGRLAFLCLRCNIDPEEIIKQLIGIRCDRLCVFQPLKFNVKVKLSSLFYLEA